MSTVANETMQVRELRADLEQLEELTTNLLMDAGEMHVMRAELDEAVYLLRAANDEFNDGHSCLVADEVEAFLSEHPEEED